MEKSRKNYLKLEENEKKIKNKIQYLEKQLEKINDAKNKIKADMFNFYLNQEKIDFFDLIKKLKTQKEELKETNQEEKNEIFKNDI